MANVPVLQSNKKKYGELLENNETVFNTVDGILSKVVGDSHSDISGGERISLENGSKIFSSKLKLPREAVAAILDKKPSSVKKMSPAELSTKYPTAPYDEILNNPDADKRAKTTATLMKAKNMVKLEAIFDAQESFKDVKGVQDGVLLKDQGLNSDLEPIGKEQAQVEPQQPEQQTQVPQEIASQVGGNILIETPQRNLFENLKFNGVKQVNKIQGVNQFSYHPKEEVNQVGKVVPQVNQPYTEYNPNDLLVPEVPIVEDIPVTEPILEEIVAPIKNKFANLQFRGYQPKTPDWISKYPTASQVGSTVSKQDDFLDFRVIPTVSEIVENKYEEVIPKKNKFEGLKYKGYEPKLPKGVSDFNYEPKNQVGVLKPSNINTWDRTKLITQPLDATLSSEQIINVQKEYEKLGLQPPVKKEEFEFPTRTVVEGNIPGWLNDHPFLTTGLGNVRAAWNNKLGRWHSGSDINAINKIKKENPGWTDETIRQTIGDYQAKSIGLKPDGTYEDSPEWRQRRAEVVKHYQDPVHQDWRHQHIQEVTLPDGTKDYRFKGYVDDGFIGGKPYGDNVADQIVFPGSKQSLNVLPKNPLTGLPFEPTTPLPVRNPNIPIPLPTRQNPNLNPSIVPGSTANPDNPLDTIELQVPKELQKAKMSTYLDLFNRQKAVPYLKNDNQTVAYQRFIPMNTLAQERGQNFLNNMYNNSDANSQLTQSINADNYGKTLEGIDNVQLKNYQSMLNTDNQNNQLYMNAFNANELAKNNNMAEYVGRVQTVEDSWDKEGEMLKDNLRNYSLQSAMTSDDFSKRRLTGLLTNEKFLPQKYGRYRYGIDQNPYFERLNTDAAYNPMLQNDQQFNTMIDKMKAAGINPKDFDDVLKAYTAQKKK